MTNAQDSRAVAAYVRFESAIMSKEPQSVRDALRREWSAADASAQAIRTFEGRPRLNYLRALSERAATA